MMDEDRASSSSTVIQPITDQEKISNRLETINAKLVLLNKTVNGIVKKTASLGSRSDSPAYRRELAQMRNRAREMASDLNNRIGEAKTMRHDQSSKKKITKLAKDFETVLAGLASAERTCVAATNDIACPVHEEQETGYRTALTNLLTQSLARTPDTTQADIDEFASVVETPGAELERVPFLVDEREQQRLRELEQEVEEVVNLSNAVNARVSAQTRNLTRLNRDVEMRPLATAQTPPDLPPPSSHTPLRTVGLFALGGVAGAVLCGPAAAAVVGAKGALLVAATGAGAAVGAAVTTGVDKAIDAAREMKRIKNSKNH
eukprot:NODE_3485_length_1211_cov_39.480699_g3306_i0.p1 GENE.NODE_3485_length_1211_cov_39.480699_g3306_i0~~NODE_3485_length_1211_cov_39.480699_g3306_i0.p1  ORF type:complete len:318 (-),score=62.47 NODE_3485_length_1211_cov_39.480699_g3306_i0:120-1073(-)